jgi:hypothetical protein
MSALMDDVRTWFVDNWEKWEMIDVPAVEK